MAHEIAERNPEDAGLALVGTRIHGVPLAQRLAPGILAGIDVPTGALDKFTTKPAMLLR
jgi:pyrimidine operon attenuation protein/uracil phosphoribosyltransferase